MSRTYGSQYYNMVKEKEKTIEKVPSEEINKRDKEFESAKVAVEQEITRVHKARLALHELLDAMASEIMKI